MDKLFKKKFLLKAALPVLILALIFSALTILFAPKSFSSASAASLATLNFENSEFESSSGSFPSTPTGWTQSTGSGASLGSTVAGILDPSTYNTSDNKLASRLEKYHEFNESDGGILPQTPFGKNNEGLGGGAKFLMINTDESTTSVKYTSSQVTLNANSFYTISAWVRTGNFATGTGASIRLNGLGGNYAFNRINTVANLSGNYDNDYNSPMQSGNVNLYGWRKYTFYIATSAFGGGGVSVSLGVGDDYVDGDKRDVNYAKGYAFFDMVEGKELTATQYNAQVARINNLSDEQKPFYQIIESELDTAFAENEAEKFAFNGNPIPDKWKYVAVSADAKTGFITGNTSGAIPTYGLDEAPKTSVGENSKSEYLNNILIISSYTKTVDDTKQYEDVYQSLQSVNTLHVPMFSYRRLSVWVKTDGVKDSSGADIVIKTDKLMNGGEDDDYMEFSISDVSGDSSAEGRHGWKEYAFYVQGSSVEDYNFSIILRLGSGENDKASGTVMFNNIRYDEITSTEFTNNSASGTVINIDGTFANNDLGVTNSAFFIAGDYEEYKYPLAPASWTKIDASSAGWTGYSVENKYCDYDNVISGIVPTGIDSYTGDMFKDFYGYGISNPRRGVKGNVLVISSKNPTALGYRSSDITLTASTTNKLSVTLKADAVGYGASLVLKNENKVISTIENIVTTAGFETFDFFIEGGTVDHTVSVEIWLGMLDRNKNNSKLSSGTVYVEQVSYEALGDNDSYSAHKRDYEDMLRSTRKITSGVYTFASEDFTAYDYYSGGVIKHPYNWTLSSSGNASLDGVIYGIFDSKNIPHDQTEIPSTFRNSENASNNGVLYLRNTSPTASRLTLSNTFTVAATTYYKLSVTLKTDLGEVDSSAIGAGVEIAGTEFKFKNIKSTAKIIDQTVDKETYKTFEFYILGGSDERNISIAITLGGSEYSNQYCTGRVYVNDITFTEIDNVQYDEAVDSLSDSEVKSLDVASLESDYPTIIKADFTTATDESVNNGETDGTTSGGRNGSVNWWLIPSILFSIALLIAIIGIVARKIIENRAKKHVKVEKISGYDRRYVPDIDDEKSTRGKAKSGGKESSLADFDDDTIEENAPSPAKPTVKVEKAESEEVAAPVAEEEQPADEAVTTEEAALSEETATTDETAATEDTATDGETAEIKEETKAEEVKEEEKAPKTEEKPAEEKKEKEEKKAPVAKPADPYVDEFDD